MWEQKVLMGERGSLSRRVAVPPLIKICLRLFFFFFSCFFLTVKGVYIKTKYLVGIPASPLVFTVFDLLGLARGRWVGVLQ